ncbi:MAG: metallophosphoesterase, partial [Victivallales bacterium]|nr:metallophosphoesterase [Victivallales bacterium]
EKLRIILSVALTLLFMIYNILNMQMILPNHHEITSNKLKNEYRFVFFADLHYGSSQSRNTVDKALDEIKELKPDYLLLGGDITDENTTKEEMEYIQLIWS